MGSAAILRDMTLCCSAEKGDVAAVDAAIAAKEKVDDRDVEGRTALMLAAAAGHDRCVRVLLSKHSASPFVKTPTGETALHFASRGGHVSCVEALLYSGADATATNQAGKNSTSFAKSGGHKEVQNMLKAWQPSLSLVNKILGNLTKHIDKRCNRIEKRIGKIEKAIK